MTAAAVLSESDPSTSRHPGPDIPFDKVMAEVEARASLALPDQLVELSDLRATETGEIEVPDVGNLNLTTWSRFQLASMLGIKWTKWFSDDLVNPEEQAEEINRRFSRSVGKYRIRARRYTAEERGRESGVLRGFVGRGYAPTDDRDVFDRLARVLGPRIHELRFVRATVTAMTSQYAAVATEAVDLGVRIPDGHKTGFLIANSEVGARALTIQVFVHRLVCTNGLVIGDSRLIYWIHRRRRLNDFGTKLGQALALLPEKWQRGMRLLEEARSASVADPAERIREILSNAPDVRKHTELVLAAYAEEPEATRFGIVQAMTRAARSLEPEARLRLEEFAGRSLVGSVTS